MVSWSVCHGSKLLARQQLAEAKEELQLLQMEIENVKKFVREMMIGYNNKVKKVWESLKGWFKQYYEDEELLDDASNFLFQLL
ncbi:unnamed protein product [Gongylonema pulchrum]|uniref:Rx_N domain-containing protein n=1 Tax=Gongylonema pulchrum TaxID=637853 RepID=A0A183F1G1_9BILA|nr:unnamed protein product [Gongylonema pulchrum]